MRIVSLVAHVPYPGIPHAGGQYVLAHIRALRAVGHEVTIVAPDWRGNAENARRLRDVSDVDVVVCAPRWTGRVAEWFDTQQIRLFPVRPPHRYRRAVQRDAAARRAVSRADLVEAQWTELGWIALALRRIAPRARLVVVVHDVIAQTYERIFATTRPRSAARGLGRWRTRSVARDEGRVYRDVDTVIVFSEKDAGYARRLRGADAGVTVLRPPFPGGDATDDGARSVAGAGATVLFVGAFFRAVNAEAAEWLIDEIIPRVRTAHPGARFVLAGAGPTARMQAAAAADPLLEVTGEMASLDPAYDEATAVVVPLRMGAGLKFKTVEALTRGIPVVSTTVGAEGLAGEGAGGGLVVADEAGTIAAALARVLDDPPRAWSEAEATRRWARSVFSAATFPHRLERALLGRESTR
ncbi:glycosyltransferase [Microbacterium sp.]|uniref:glycosyltransferase n=1 Tax=Microbacterium sp. TaxID=51671 RepID=UPI003918FA10